MDIRVEEANRGSGATGENDQITSSKVFLHLGVAPQGTLERRLRMPRRRVLQDLCPVQPVSTAPLSGCKRQPLPAGSLAILEGDTEERLIPVNLAGGVLDAGFNLIWKNYRCGHFLHAEFKMLIPVASVRSKPTGSIKKKSGETSVMRKHMTKDRKKY